MRAQWEREKKDISASKEIKQQIEDVKLKMEEAERNYDLDLLAKLKYGELPALEQQLRDAKETLEKDSKSENRLIKEEVDEPEIAEVVSKWTGIPVAKLVEAEREKLLSPE